MRLQILILGFSIIVSSLYADKNRTAADTKWTHSWSEGEDASSTHYYFLETRGRVVRVRMLWNGGAQHDPTLTDWFLNSGHIRIVKKKGERKGLPDLIQGKDTTLKVTSDYKLACEHSGKMLVPTPSDKALTPEQRLDLYNLIWLLSEDRELYRNDAQQAGASEGEKLPN